MWKDLHSAIIAIQVELTIIHKNISTLCFLLISSQIPKAAFEGCVYEDFHVGSK